MTDMQRGRSGAGLIVLLALGALIVMALGMRSCVFELPGMSFMDRHSFLTNFAWFGPYSLFGLGGLIQIGLAIWVGMDAERRGMNGWLWGLLVLFTFIVGLLVYLIVGQSMGPRPAGTTFARAASPFVETVPRAAHAPPRPDPPSSVHASGTCPGCRADVLPDYKICPHCGSSLRCRECNETLRGGWKLCPQCGTPIPARSSSDS